MPSKSPPIGEQLTARLKLLGNQIRACREQLKVNATATAEAAGLSRVTLHRIERGEPSVTMGAYMSAMAAVGLDLCVVDALKRPGMAPVQPGRAAIQIDRYPQLKQLAWQQPGTTALSPTQALSLYERNWRHIDQASLGPDERALIESLVASVGAGRLLV